MKNKTILQAFEWDLKADATHWNHLSDIAASIGAKGLTSVWLPPAYKGASGIHDVGYGVYDFYDLGEFNQKGSIPTKYGTKDEYLRCIHTLQSSGLEVYGDIVLDHLLGADEKEEVEAVKVAHDNRYQLLSGEETILAWTKFTYPERNKKYSDYVWTWKNFNGVDYDAYRKEDAIFGFEGKEWTADVDKENGNFDYLMGADMDMENPETLEQLNKWGSWYQTLTNLDGYRLDAVKHIQFTFFIDWLNHRKKEAKKELFVVGEYWHGDIGALENYLNTCDGVMSLFDVPLHFHLKDASATNGQYDMRNLFERTLSKNRPWNAVTFVDNHDTQPGQSLDSWVQGWFKVCAYALILLRSEGIPCVFYGDLYGIPEKNIDPVGIELEILLKVREKLAYGRQIEYLDHPDIIGWTRSGDDEHANSGLALIVSNAQGGRKDMFVGEHHANDIFVDCLGNIEDEIKIRSDGSAIFPVKDGSVSVWVSKEAKW